MIERLPDGNVELHLSSPHRVSTDFNWYAHYWIDGVMADIQETILTVIQKRCEARAHEGTAHSGLKLNRSPSRESKVLSPHRVIALHRESSYPDRESRRFVVEPEQDQDPNSKKSKRSRWLWPMGLLATGMAGAAVVLRGCWHSKMSWPIRSQGVAYQVCTGCGIKRLFDEDAFRGYGPYSYDLQRLVDYDQARRLKNQPQASPDEHRTAS